MAAGAVALLVCACTPFSRPLVRQNTVRTQEEAGSALIAILSIVPWFEYREQLQPHFNLSEEEALRKVVPTTSVIEERLIDMVSARLQLGSGQPKQPDAGPSTPKNGDDAGLPGGGLIPASLGRDPMLEYLAATALKQEVEMLNTYVRNAAVHGDYDAYVIRLQVSLHPRARRMPYDAYSTISFFSNEQEPQTPTLAATQAAAQTGTTRCERPVPALATPRVVPLLVTDNLEAALHAGSRERIRELGVTLSSLVNGASAGVGVKSSRHDLQRVIAEDINGLLTVARGSDNSIRVRFGASQIGPEHYTMVARTQSVTLLVLMPKESRSLQAIARTDFVNARTGKDLRQRSHATMLKQARKRMATYGSKAAAMPDRTIEHLIGQTRQSDLAGFDKTLCAYDKTLAVHRRAIWTDLVALRAGSQYSTVTANLPACVRPAIAAQIPFGLDDGQNRMVVTLQGVHAVSPTALAVWTVSSAGKQYPFAAQSITIDPAQARATLLFPTLKPWRFGPDLEDPRNCRLVIMDTKDRVLRDFDSCVYRLERKPKVRKPVVTVTPGASFVSLALKTLILTIDQEVDSGAPPLTLRFINAQVDERTVGKGKPKTDLAGVLVRAADLSTGFVVNKDGTVTLLFENVALGRKIQAVFKQGDRIVKTLQFDVVK